MISFLTLLLPVYYLNNPLSLPPLPSCGSHLACTPSYNYILGVLSLTTCQAICLKDPQCKHYSYNYRVGSPHYRHCYLARECDYARQVVGDKQWLSGPRECKREGVGRRGRGRYTDRFIRTIK
jgi:hypothetical protein